MQGVRYKDTVLHRNSEAYRLWQEWQSAKTDRNQAQRKLDQHLKEVDQRARELMTRYDAKN